METARRAYRRAAGIRRCLKRQACKSCRAWKVLCTSSFISSAERGCVLKCGTGRSRSDVPRSLFSPVFVITICSAPAQPLVHSSWIRSFRTVTISSSILPNRPLNSVVWIPSPNASGPSAHGLVPRHAQDHSRVRGSRHSRGGPPTSSGGRWRAPAVQAGYRTTRSFGTSVSNVTRCIQLSPKS